MKLSKDACDTCKFIDRCAGQFYGCSEYEEWIEEAEG